MPRRLRSSVTVRVCATSANMGAGFDCIGIALQLFNDLTLSSVLPDGSPVPAFAMTCVGEGSSGLPLDPSNLVARGARLAFLEAGYSSSGDGWEGLPPVAFHLVNRIPIAAGLGSSSAAIVAGLLAGLTLTGTTMSVENEERMLQLAASVEGHVDNLAACIYGGMQIGVHTGQRFFTSAVPIPPGLQCILFIPDQRQSTEGARAVLPPTVSRADAVYNIGRAALLVNAFATGALADLALATEDALHQPARAAIMPAMLPVIAAAREAGALGAFLSGAGSAILALTAGRKGDPHSQSPGERRDVRVARAMVQGARSVGMAGRVLVTHPCTGLGAHVVELDGDEGAVVAGRGLDLLEGGSSEVQAPAAGAAAHTAAAAAAALAEDTAWVARARAAAVAVNPAAAAGSLRYVSTRAASPQHSPSLTFSQAVFAGTAPDGGLYVPACIPRGALTPQLLAELEGLPYSRLAARVLGVWIGEEEIPLADLLQLTQQAYAESRWPGSGRVSGAPEGQGAVVAPLIQLQCSSSSASSSTVPVHVLELFHGPTAAFKDIALQLLGCLIPYLMARAPPGSTTVPRRVTVLGATSGDTGAAAVAGLQGAPGVSLVILHPAGRVAPVQAAQMTSVLAPNVHNVAVAGEGTCFDACQAAVKGAFADPAFVARHSLCAINSINWARVLAQSVYYVHAAVAWQAAQRAEGRALVSGGAARHCCSLLPTSPTHTAHYTTPHPPPPPTPSPPPSLCPAATLAMPWLATMQRSSSPPPSPPCTLPPTPMTQCTGPWPMGTTADPLDPASPPWPPPWTSQWPPTLSAPSTMQPCSARRQRGRPALPLLLAAQ